MNSRDFVFWLQGYFELMDDLKNDDNGAGGKDKLSMSQVKSIKKHLNLVFIHDIDPSMGDKEHQGKLDEVHHILPDHMNSEMSEEELDKKYGVGVRPRC